MKFKRLSKARFLKHLLRLSVLLTVVLLGVIYLQPAPLSTEANSGNGQWQSFDDDLKINLVIAQNNNHLTMTIGQLEFHDQIIDADPVLLRTISWQAVRINGTRCDGHVFHQFASLTDRGQIHSGNFTLPRLTLDFEDHQKYYCFNIRYQGRHIYQGSQRIAVIPPKIQQIRQTASRLWINLAARHYAAGTSYQWRYTKVADTKLRQNYFGNACNKELFQSIQREESRRPPYFQQSSAIKYKFTNNSPSIQIGLNQNDLGYRYCFEVISRAAGTSHADYASSHRITNLTTNYVPSPARVFFGGNQVPKQFGIEEAITILESQLTPLGQQILEQTKVRLFSEEPTNWFFGPSIDFSNRGLHVYGGWRQGIYINDNLFATDYYATLPEDDKILIIKDVIETLTHELMHVVDHELAIASTIPLKCQSNKEFLSVYQTTQAVFDSLYGRQRPYAPLLSNDEEIADYKFFWSTYEKCLDQQPAYGSVLRSLKKTFVLLPPDYPFQDSTRYAPINYAESLLINERGEQHFIGSPNWYKELYAEMPLRILELPADLEDHYGQIFTNRRQFAEIMYTKGRLWPWTP